MANVEVACGLWSVLLGEDAPSQPVGREALSCPPTNLRKGEAMANGKRRAGVLMVPRKNRDVMKLGVPSKNDWGDPGSWADLAVDAVGRLPVFRVKKVARSQKRASRRPGDVPPLKGMSRRPGDGEVRPRLVDLQPILAPKDEDGPVIQAYVPMNLSQPVKAGDVVVVRGYDRKPKTGVPVEVNLRIAKVIKPERIRKCEEISSRLHGQRFRMLSRGITSEGPSSRRRSGSRRAQPSGDVGPGQFKGSLTV